MTIYTSQHWADHIGDEVQVPHAQTQGQITEVDHEGRVFVKIAKPFSVRTVSGRIVQWRTGQTLPFWPHQLQHQED